MCMEKLGTDPASVTPLPDKPSSVRRLPLMLTAADAEALATQSNDPFYRAAFLIQHWLAFLLARAAAQYAEHKHHRDRSLQSGEAWRALSAMFNLKPDEPCTALLSCLYRFSVEDNSPRNTLRHALARLSIEHHCTGDYFGPKTMRDFFRKPKVSPLAPRRSSLKAVTRQPPFANQKRPSPPATLDTLCRRTLVRWCAWLDSEIHLRTHRHWHECPASFHPDPETRYLAALGNAQRHLANLDLQAQASWVFDMGNAAQHFKDSPKWAALGKAMADRSDRPWLYPDVDTMVIGLWPLVTAYNWTYRDLLNVIQPMLKRPDAYPCSVEHEFAPYCANVLGLKKTGRGRSAKNGRPKGYDVVLELCPALKR